MTPLRDLLGPDLLSGPGQPVKAAGLQRPYRLDRRYLRLPDHRGALRVLGEYRDRSGVGQHPADLLG